MMVRSGVLVFLVTILWERATGGAIVVTESAPPSGPLPDTMTEKELEGLLHFAIRNSDPSKLHEMASHEKKISPEEAREVMEAMYSSESLFFETVNNLIIHRNWTSEEEMNASFEFIEDYGDHLVDKGDLLNSVGALEKLVNWVIEPNETPSTRKRVADLLVSLTQNREPTKLLVLRYQPEFVVKILVLISPQDHNCEANDEVCASLISLITAIMGGNEILMKQTEQSVIVPIAHLLSRLSPSSKTFARILTLLKVVPITEPGSAWTHAIARSELLGLVGTRNTTLQIGERILQLLSPIDDQTVKQRLHAQCIELRKHDPDSCSRFSIDRYKDEL